MFTQECTDPSDLQCPQRWRSIHPDDQFPAERKKWEEYRQRRGEKKRTKLDRGYTKMHKNYLLPNTMTLNRDHDHNSCHYVQFNYAVYNGTTVECPVASVLILLEKSNIHTAKWKFTALLCEKGRFFLSRRHPGAYRGCLPARALICSYESAAQSRRRPIPFLSSPCQAPYSFGARA